MNKLQDSLRWFRHAAPYLKAQRDRVFVIYFSGESIADNDTFAHLIEDVVLLHNLGAKPVLVYGARPQIEEHLTAQGMTTHYAQGLRVTDAQSLESIKAVVGSIRFELESRLSMASGNIPPTRSPTAAKAQMVSGNLITARPLGVQNGVDFQYTGEVRRVETGAIHSLLNNGQMVLIPPLGYSPTGEIFNLDGASIATAIASALPADKLILYSESKTPDLHSPRQLSLSEARDLLATAPGKEVRNGHQPHCHPPVFYRHLTHAALACQQGVERAHLIPAQTEGALLFELFTRDGIGTMVHNGPYDTTRIATIDDLGGVLALITPLETAGVLVHRSREKIESTIHDFLVMERDGAVIACAAALSMADCPMEGPHPKMMELACLAVHQDYRNRGRGDALLRLIENQALGRGGRHLFVLTTHTEHWFLEHGFSRAGQDDLPPQRRQMYDISRNAKVLIKPLKG